MFGCACGNWADALEEAANTIVVRGSIDSDGWFSFTAESGIGIFAQILLFVPCFFLASALYLVIATINFVVSLFLLPISVIAMLVCSFTELKIWFLIFVVIFAALTLLTYLSLLIIMVISFPDLFANVDTSTWWGQLIDYIKNSEPPTPE